MDFESQAKILAGRVYDGDREAIGDLWVMLIPVAETAVRSLIRHDENREDVLQDVLLEVPKFIEIYLRKTRNENKIGGFFYRAFRFAAFNASRKIRYRRAWSLDATPQVNGGIAVPYSQSITSDHPAISPAAECFECGAVFAPQHPAQVACSADCYGKIRVRAQNITAVATDLEPLLAALRSGVTSRSQLEEVVSGDVLHMRLTLLRAIGFDIVAEVDRYQLRSNPSDSESLIVKIVRWQAAGCLVSCWICDEVFQVLPHHPKSCCSARCRAKLRSITSVRSKITERKATELSAIVELLKLGPATKQKLRFAAAEPITQIAMLRAFGYGISLSERMFRLDEIPEDIDLGKAYSDWLDGTISDNLACIVCDKSFHAKKRSQPGLSCGPKCADRLSKLTKVIS